VSSTALSTAGRFPVRRKRPNRPSVDNAPRPLASTERVPVHPSPAERSRLQALLRDASQLQFYLDESESLTVEQIGAKARRLQREKGLAIVIVDYLQLIADSRQNPNASRAESVREIALGLKQLARDLAVPVIVLSQVSRALESPAEKRPIMSDLRDSGGLESHADLILFLYRDEVYNPESQDAGTAEIIVSKNRNGPAGTVRVGFEAETLRFRQFLELGDGSLSRSGAAHR